jgi:hypothetical protein
MNRSKLEEDAMRYLPAALLTAMLLLPSTIRAQTTSDFSGTWTMDPARSESAQQGEAIKPSTVVIAQTATELRVETTRGERHESVVYSLGKTPRAAAGPAAAGQPAAYWEGDKLVTETQRPVNGMTVTVKEARTLGPTGREMTVETIVIVQHGYSMPGAKNYGTSKDIFTKTTP